MSSLITFSLIAIGFFLLTLRREKLAFYLLLVLVPLAHKELFSLGVWNLLPVRAALLGVVPAYLLRYRRRLSWSNLRQDGGLVALGLLLLVRVLSLVNSADRRSSLELVLFLIFVLFWYGWFKELVRKYGRGFWERALGVYLGLVVLAGVFALIQLYVFTRTGEVIGSVWNIPGRLLRLGSSFWDVNHFGGFVLTALPLFLFRSLGEVRPLRRAAYLVGLVFLTAILFMTHSRSSWLGAVVITPLIIWQLLRSRWKRWVIGLGAVSLLVLVGGVYYLQEVKDISLIGRYRDYQHLRLDSSDTHRILLERSFLIFKKHPLLGGGYGDFDSDLRQTEGVGVYFERDPGAVATKVPCHSIWGCSLAETGFLGTIAFLGLIAFLYGLYLTAALAAKSDSDRLLVGGFVYSLLAILVAGVFYSFNIEYFWLVIFFGILGAGLILGREVSYGEGLRLALNDRRFQLGLLIPLGLILFLWGITTTHLIDFDEAIYGQIAKNITEFGEWLTLRWKSYDDLWFEKPPLYFWLTAVWIYLFKARELAVRLTSALFGLGTVLLTYRLGERLWGKLVGFTAAVILMTSPLYLYYARSGMLDVTVGFFLLASLYCFYLAHKEKKTIFWVLTGVSLGLGVMTKAVVGLLTLPTILMMAGPGLFRRPERRQLVRGLGLMFLSFLVVAAPWHLYAHLRYGNKFWSEYLGYHVWARAFSDSEGKTRPLLWYWEVLRFGFRIWLIPLLLGLPLLIVRLAKRSTENRLLILTSLVIFGFFSVSRSKLIWYIVPIFPYLSLLSAEVIYEGFNFLKRLTKRDEVILSLLVVVPVVALGYLYSVRDLVYREDYSGDTVALIELKHDLYGRESTLYYQGIDDPVPYFYHKGETTGIAMSGLTEKIENRGFSDNYIAIVKTPRAKELQAKHPVNVEEKRTLGDLTLVVFNSEKTVISGRILSLGMEKERLLARLAAGEGSLADDERQREIEVEITYWQNLLATETFVPEDCPYLR